MLSLRPFLKPILLLALVVTFAILAGYGFFLFWAYSTPTVLIYAALSFVGLDCSYILYKGFRKRQISFSLAGVMIIILAVTTIFMYSSVYDLRNHVSLLENKVNNLTQSNTDLQNAISNLTPVIIPSQIQTQLAQEHYYYYLNRSTEQIIGAQIICSGYMNGSLVVISPCKARLNFEKTDFVPDNTDQMIDPNKLNLTFSSAVWLQEDMVPGENLVNLTESLQVAFSPNLQKLSDITSETVTFRFGDMIFLATLYDLQGRQIASTSLSTAVLVTINPHSSTFGGYG
jgi:cell division protein FtsB